jgi:menaquinone-dependent protoporphyrinogen IX oxidase
VKALVLYASKSGNTKKVADSIATELDCQAVQLTQTNTLNVNLNDYDLIFVGSGINFGNPNENVIHYLQSADLLEPKRFAVFLTWGGAGKTDRQALDKLQSVLKSKGQIVMADVFRCFGGRQFTLSKRGHPNGDDLVAAKTWAKKVSSETA